MKNIFISTTSFGIFDDEPLELLNKKGFKVIQNNKGRKLRDDEIVSALEGCIGVIAGTETYSKEVLSKLNHIKVISRLGVGIDNIDLNYIKKLNIKVCKTEINPAPAVAELTLGLIMDLLRKITYQNGLLKLGFWKKHMGRLLSGKTLGIIGFGNIGKELVKITKGFELTYMINDFFIDEKYTNNESIKYSELDQLLSKSDIVSIHTNLTKKNIGFFNNNVIRKMKKSAILINTSRGEIINEDDLVQAIEHGLIAGAGLDVFQNEPYSGPLSSYDNVIITPHIGSYAQEIRNKMEKEAVLNLISGFN